MKSIWILVRKENSGDNGLQIHLGYSGMYGSDVCPAFSSREDAEFFQKNVAGRSSWTIFELPIWGKK